MSYDMAYDHEGSVAASPANVRVEFIKKTYGHLAGAIIALVAIEAVLLQLNMGVELLNYMSQTPYSSLMLIVLFIGGGFAANYMARSSTSVPTQYLGLGLYVCLWSVILLPILTYAEYRFAGEMVPLQAGILTLAIFAGLTFGVVASGKDFSFMGPILGILSFAALGYILMAIIFGFNLGVLFTVFMIVLAAGYIVYDTSKIMYHYHPGQHVAAALELFGSVAMLFFYILRLFMAMKSD